MGEYRSIPTLSPSPMRPVTLAAALALAALPLSAQKPLTVYVSSSGANPAPSAFTLEQVTSYPFPDQLTAAPSGGRIARALNGARKRNIWTGDAPE